MRRGEPKVRRESEKRSTQIRPRKKETQVEDLLSWGHKPHERPRNKVLVNPPLPREEKSEEGGRRLDANEGRGNVWEEARKAEGN